MNKGFSLIELVIVVAILSILAAIGVPQYIGYTANAKATTAKDALKVIYLQQQEYYHDHGGYYVSSASSNGTSNCTASTTTEINTVLFNGKTVVESTDYTYCVSNTSTDNFTAYAKSGSTSYTIDNNNNTNF